MDRAPGSVRKKRVTLINDINILNLPFDIILNKMILLRTDSFLFLYSL